MTTAHTTHQLETFPAELRDRRQWVLWAIEERDGKRTKVPRRVDAPAIRASSTDPTSWGSFDEAVAALETAPEGISGAGFVFTAGDPFAGVDLDRCMGADGQLVPEAQRIVDHLSSYTERSPSGEGLHIIVRGNLPAGRKAMQEWGGHLEAYPHGRYFTVTGDHLEGTPASIEDRQLQLEELLPAKASPPAHAHLPAGGFDGDDLELLERARSARNGSGFSQLYDAGDTSAHDGDASGADLALCNLLAFWTGRDAARMDRLFRGSGLMREKWDHPARAGETYGAGTIREAIEGCTDTYGAAEPTVTVQGSPEAAGEIVHGPAEGTVSLELEEVLTTYRKWLLLPDDPASILIPLAVAQANRMEGDPVWLLDIRPPGWGKTEGLGPIAGALREAHMVSTLTEAALLSGTSRREKAKDSTGGLLRTVGEFGIIVLKDFTSILSMHREARASTIAALREIYDGSWVRNVGTDGGRTLEWRGKVGLIAGCTEAYDRHHGVIGSMGDRFLIHRPPNPDAEAVADRALDVAGHEAEMRHALTEAVSGLFAGLPFGEQPEQLLAASRENEQLVDVAVIATQARSTVERDDYHRNIENVHGAESPARVVKQLMLIRAALITIGVSPEEAHRLTTCVALDSIPQHRRRALRDLVRRGPDRRVTTADAAGDMGLPVRTTERVLEDLQAQKMVLCEAGAKGPGNTTQWHIAPGWYEKWRRSVPEGL